LLFCLAQRLVLTITIGAIRAPKSGVITLLFAADLWAWAWAVVIIPLAAFGTLAALAVIASGLLGIMQTTVAPQRPGGADPLVAERQVLKLLRETNRPLRQS